LSYHESEDKVDRVPATAHRDTDLAVAAGDGEAQHPHSLVLVAHDELQVVLIDAAVHHGSSPEESKMAASPLPSRCKRSREI
jgi:hypothetical protein